MHLIIVFIRWYIIDLTFMIHISKRNCIVIKIIFTLFLTKLHFMVGYNHKLKCFKNKDVKQNDFFHKYNKTKTILHTYIHCLHS